MSKFTNFKAGLFAAACAVIMPGLLHAQTPMTGGKLRMVAPFGSALTSLDPHKTYESQDMVVSQAFHRSLYKWDTASNQPVLDLAQSVEAGPDGKTYIYKLFDNIYFHNGRKMTADDVIWSFTRIMDPKQSFYGTEAVGTIEGAKEYAEGKAATISGLKKIDDLTFSMTLANAKDPGEDFFEAITSILPKEEVEKPDFARHPVGLGPFVFTEHVEGSRVSGTKFDKYFKSGKPYVDSIDFTITDDYSAMDMAFRAQELDIIILSDAYPQYKEDPELSKGLIEVPELFTRHLGLNNEMAPLNDVRVRQAINYAINRELIIEKIAKNKAYIATSWLPTTSVAFDKDRKPYPYDPAKAKALLAEAGLKDGFELEISITPGAVSIFEAIMPFLKDVGITAKPRILESTVLVDDINNGRAMAWYRSNTTGPDPLNALRSFDSRTSRLDGNRFGFKDPAYDAIIDKLTVETDPVKRVELAKEADAYIFDKAPIWFFNYNKGVLATQPWVHGVGGNVTETAIIDVDNVWLDENAPSR